MEVSSLEVTVPCLQFLEGFGQIQSLLFLLGARLLEFREACVDLVSEQTDLVPFPRRDRREIACASSDRLDLLGELHDPPEHRLLEDRAHRDAKR